MKTVSGSSNQCHEFAVLSEKQNNQSPVSTVNGFHCQNDVASGFNLSSQENQSTESTAINYSCTNSIAESFPLSATYNQSTANCFSCRNDIASAIPPKSTNNQSTESTTIKATNAVHNNYQSLLSSEDKGTNFHDSSPYHGQEYDVSHKCSVGRESTNKANVLRELPCQQPPSTESIKVHANSSDAQTSHSTHVHNSETIRNDSRPFCSISNGIKDCETTEVKLDDLASTCLYAKVKYYRSAKHKTSSRHRVSIFFDFTRCAKQTCNCCFTSHN